MREDDDNLLAPEVNEFTWYDDIIDSRPTRDGGERLPLHLLGMTVATRGSTTMMTIMTIWQRWIKRPVWIGRTHSSVFVPQCAGQPTWDGAGPLRRTLWWWPPPRRRAHGCALRQSPPWSRQGTQPGAPAVATVWPPSSVLPSMPRSKQGASTSSQKTPAARDPVLFYTPARLALHCLLLLRLVPQASRHPPPP